ncbi:MAG: C4-dicarboxylate TRAP transporter substrate-binding protein [Alphaproteobacteria bacterium]|nr:C4-dicarboxylate TRAP transporter substrate-binding protein [Alphaproteobacteria bacterium]
MERRNSLGAAIGAAILGLTLSAAPATEVVAKTLKSAVGLAPTSAQYYAHSQLAEYVKEHTKDLRIKVYSMSLLNLKETPPGLRDGIADMGFVLPPYFPAEYSEFNLAANVSMLATTGRQVESPGAAMAGATNEYVFFHCPECLAQFQHENQVYLGTAASPTYILLCTKPIRTLNDLKGRKFSSGAANFGRWAEYFGGIRVTISGNDVYEALSQGVIDCSMQSATELTNLSLFDVVKFVTRRIPGGVFSGVATNNMNLDSWRSLSLEDRKVLLKGSARVQADNTWKYYSDAKKNLEDAPGKGVEVIEPDPAILAKSDEFVKGDMKVIAEQFRKDYGVQNTDEKIAKLAELTEKWKTLTEGVEDDPAALAEVYWNEVFSKLDPETYGMK